MFSIVVKALLLFVFLGGLVRVTQGPNKSAIYAFNLAILSSCLPSYCLSLIGKLYTESGTEEEKKEKRARWAKVVITTTALCWRMGLAACFWVKIEIEGIAELRRNFGSTGRPLCFILNHTSFLDIFLAVTSVPLSKVGKMKMIVSSHVLEMPVIGRMAKGSCHLAVPFKDTSGGSFEVDKEALAVTMETFENHLKSGEGCAWFPEGQVNKGDCSKLQQFRAGGLGIIVRNDVELWCMATVGNATCWPMNAPLGGQPAKIGGTVKCVCESSKEFLSSAETGSTEREKSLYLADHTSKRIQAVIDAYIAKGYKAGDNTKKKKTKDVADAGEKVDGGTKQE